MSDSAYATWNADAMEPAAVFDICHSRWSAGRTAA